MGGDSYKTNCKGNIFKIKMKVRTSFKCLNPHKHVSQAFKTYITTRLHNIIHNIQPMFATPQNWSVVIKGIF